MYAYIFALNFLTVLGRHERIHDISIIDSPYCDENIEHVVVLYNAKYLSWFSLYIKSKEYNDRVFVIRDDFNVLTTTRLGTTKPTRWGVLLKDSRRSFFFDWTSRTAMRHVYVTLYVYNSSQFWKYDERERKRKTNNKWTIDTRLNTKMKNERQNENKIK